MVRFICSAAINSYAEFWFITPSYISNVSLHFIIRPVICLHIVVLSNIPHHHLVMPSAQISLTLSRHLSLAFIAFVTELLYVGLSWPPFFCSAMWRGPWRHHPRKLHVLLGNNILSDVYMEHQQFILNIMNSLERATAGIGPLCQCTQNGIYVL